MTFTFRPAIRENTPLIIGIAGPTKSGKTYSAHRIAIGLANGGTVAMLNAEGARGHQYADKFKYVAADIEPPYSPKRYTEALQEVAKLKPSVLILDSASHMHDGPGGMLEWHDTIADKMAGGDRAKRDRVTWTAWIEPKKAENEFIYTMLGLKCPVILCFRAKEKLKIVPGKPPIDLGWQPIASDRVAFETIFTLMLEPHSKGVPTRELSELREPFDKIIQFDQAIDESLGRRLAAWASGGEKKAEAQLPESARTGQEVLKSTAEPAASAPAQSSITPDDWANAEESVDTETGEITPSRHPFYMPGNALPKTFFESHDAWFASWQNISDLVTGSQRISPDMKEKKLRALKSVNDAAVKKMGSSMIAKVSGDFAARMKSIKDQAAELEKAEAK